jgi:hypothetical protein
MDSTGLLAKKELLNHSAQATPPRGGLLAFWGKLVGITLLSLKIVQLSHWAGPISCLTRSSEVLTVSCALLVICFSLEKV